MLVKMILVTFLFLHFVIDGCACAGDSNQSLATCSAVEKVERWPDYSPDMTEQFRLKVSQAQQEYLARNFSLGYREAYTYSSFGSYLGYGVYGRSCQGREVADKRKLNKVGVMMQKTVNGFQTSPVLSAQCGMQLYFFENRQLSETVRAYVADLITSQDELGAFRYNYPYRWKDIELATGWASGMAQGQVLSFFSRILQDHDSPEIYSAAEKALSFLITPIQDGGVMSTLADLDPSLDSYIMFEEIVDPDNAAQSHILNGFIFSLLGLYDWWQLNPEVQEGSHYLAKLYFQKGIETLEKVLPYYDALGFSLYDIGHLTGQTKTYHLAPAHYHYAHLYLLQAMYGITHRPVIGHLLRRWSADIGYFHDY